MDARTHDAKGKRRELPETVIADFEQNFNVYYNYPLNSNPDSFEIEISIEDFLASVPSAYLTEANKGLAFHYILLDNGGNLYFAYAMSLWKYDTLGLVIIETLSNGKYKGLGTIGTIDIETLSELNNLKDLYYDNVWNKTEGINPKKINTFPKHPRYYYHEGTEITALLDDNVMALNDKIRISNGAIYRADIHNLNVQTPIITCIKNGVEQLNDQTYPAIFKMKGLDVGRLCPPDCNQ